MEFLQFLMKQFVQTLFSSSTLDRGKKKQQKTNGHTWVPGVNIDNAFSLQPHFKAVECRGSGLALRIPQGCLSANLAYMIQLY